MIHGGGYNYYDDGLMFQGEDMWGNHEGFAAGLGLEMG